MSLGTPDNRREMSESMSLDVKQLVADHHQSVYRYAYRLSGSVADAEDLSQQAFLIAHSKLDQLRDESAAKSWLFTILRNCFSKSLRRRQPVPAANLELNVDEIAGEMPLDGPFDEERLQTALGQLPDEFRLVLLMYYFEDLTYREIAYQQGIPIGTVMSRLSRGKGYLRSMLLEQEYQGTTPPENKFTP